MQPPSSFKGFASTTSLMAGLSCNNDKKYINFYACVKQHKNCLSISLCYFRRQRQNISNTINNTHSNIADSLNLDNWYTLSSYCKFKYTSSNWNIDFMSTRPCRVSRYTPPRKLSGRESWKRSPFTITWTLQDSFLWSWNQRSANLKKKTLPNLQLSFLHSKS